MRPKLLYLPFLIFTFCLQAQQELNFDLLSSGVRQFDHHFFVYGLRETPERTTLLVYKLDNQLKVKDSVAQVFPKTQASDFLPLNSDTLHQLLSIHIQKKGETKLRIFRCKSSLEQIALIEQVEVPRLNSAAMFRSSPYYFKNIAYAIRQTVDSGINQFYLDKYSLLSEKQNYDYKPEWQWAFEKKDMEAACVIYADQRSVYLFAWRANQEATGQWLLKIDAKTGVLKRAVKLNAKTEDAYYQFGACFYEPGKNLYLTGQKFLKNKDGRPPCENKEPLLYLLEIDSLTEIISRDQFTIALPKTPGVQKCNAILLRFSSFEKDPSSGLRGEVDLFKKEGSALCFLFNNTFTLSIRKEEDIYQFKSSVMLNQPALSGVVNGGDKLDLNGKICPEGDSHTLFNAPLLAPVKIKIVNDSLQKQMWLFNKIDVRKKSKQFSVLRPVKGVYQLQPIENFKLDQSANVFILPEQKFFISHYTPEGKLRIKLYNW